MEVINHTKSRLKAAIVIPVYRESANIRALYSRLEDVTKKLDHIEWEYVLVNDGSPDGSLEVLYTIASEDPKFKVLDLSRNFGKEIALSAGVHEVEDVDIVICMDADLQHPPEYIPLLLAEWERGAEVVVTVRTETKKQPILRRIGSFLYYWLMSKISGLDMRARTTDYRLYDKKVIEAFKHATERERMFRGIMDWMGFRKTYIEFKADARYGGEAGYSYAKLWRLAINSITSYSLWPLKITGYLGGMITVTSGSLLSWMIVNYFIHSNWDYTPLAIVVVANTFFIGIVLMSIGLVAMYVGNIHTEVINRPLYIIRERINFSSSSK